MKIIDTNNNTTSRLGQFRVDGIETVIRYLSTNLAGEKVVKASEARAISQVGLKLGLVFEIWGGADNFRHGDITAASGKQHGTFARDYAPKVGTPDGTIIWFAIDTDVSEHQFVTFVKPYLQAAKQALAGKYRIGVYACGMACAHALDQHLVDATWLTQSMGWNGSRAFRTSNRWRLLQGPETTLHGLSVDSNQSNGDDYGGFIPFGVSIAIPPAQPPPIVKPDQPTPRKALFSVRGKMSTFGGPRDTGMKPDEGLALFQTAGEMTLHRLGDFLLPQAQFPGLGRRLNPEKPYLACRWPTARYPFLKDAVAWVSNPRTGKLLPFRPVDWGPNARTGRVADLSPGGAKALGLQTDDECVVTVYEDGR